MGQISLCIQKHIEEYHNFNGSTSASNAESCSGPVSRHNQIVSSTRNNPTESVLQLIVNQNAMLTPGSSIWTLRTTLKDYPNEYG